MNSWATGPHIEKYFTVRECSQEFFRYALRMTTWETEFLNFWLTRLKGRKRQPLLSSLPPSKKTPQKWTMTTMMMIGYLHWLEYGENNFGVMTRFLLCLEFRMVLHWARLIYCLSPDSPFQCIYLTDHQRSSMSYGKINNTGRQHNRRSFHYLLYKYLFFNHALIGNLELALKNSWTLFRKSTWIEWK